ncbi:ef hand family protein [Histomonas meleagridis]|uniref:ef hand family protein n=1 Tax=Histomonas meleagridis TaxID=135588 RepID=UPI00355AB3A0|nr:ef hand family protein [Histomonas meleagridis]KAH0806263.1 ef hand family protein [Histomonas meleagridis]
MEVSRVTFDLANPDVPQKQEKEGEGMSHYDPLSEFNILTFISWNDETLKQLSKEWDIRGERGLNLAEFVHVMLKFFPEPESHSTSQKRIWVQKLVNFFRQIDYNRSNSIQWQNFLSFITSCCVFDREKTRVDTVVKYHYEKEIICPSGDFGVIKFLYDSMNDHVIGFTFNGFILVFSPTSLSLIRKIKLEGKPVNAIFDGCIIPERSLMAIVYPTGIEVLNLTQSYSLAQDIPTPESTHFCIEYDPNTHTIFTGNENGKLHCWVAENWGEKPSRMNWHCISSIKIPNESSLTCIALIPNSSSFATGDESGALNIWDRKKLRLIHHVQAHQAPIHTISYSEPLHALVTAAHETTVKAWNPFIPSVVSTINCPTGVVSAMTCIPHTSHLIIADRKGNVHIINSRMMTIVQSFSISPYGGFVSKVNLTETTQKMLNRSLQITGASPIAAISHCGQHKRFVIGGRMIQFYEYDENIKPTESDRIPIRYALVNTLFHMITTCSGQNIQQWDLSTGEMRSVFRSIAPSMITALSLDDTQTLLFVGCHGGELLCVHFLTGKVVCFIGKHTSDITAVSYIPKLQTVITAGWGGTITLWNNETNGRKANLVTENKDDLLCMAVNQEHLIIAVGTGKGEITLWNLSKLKSVGVLKPQKVEAEILALEFVDDSSLLCSTDSFGCITFWNVITEEPHAVTQLPNFYIGTTTSNILGLAFYEKYLVTADNNGELRLWDVQHVISQFPDKKKAETQINSTEYQALINQRGNKVMTSTEEAKEVLSNVNELPIGSFQLILKWKAHLAAVTSVSIFKANGQPIVLTSSEDCCVSIWEMKTGKCLGFLQSNPSFGLSERRWALKYDKGKESLLSITEIDTIIHEADSVKTPPISPR